MKDFTYIEEFEKIINQNKYSILQIFILYCMKCHDNYKKLKASEKDRILKLIYTFYLKDENKFDLAHISDEVMENYQKILKNKIVNYRDIYIYL